jgi:L-ascorbate peroxidase
VQSISIDKWPKCGGANGSIRFDPEILHGANKGLKNALNLLEPIVQKYKTIGAADMYQLASATAVLVCTDLLLRILGKLTKLR